MALCCVALPTLSPAAALLGVLAVCNLAPLRGSDGWQLWQVAKLAPRVHTYQR
jgi:hypothetical protein